MDLLLTQEMARGNGCYLPPLTGFLLYSQDERERREEEREERKRQTDGDGERDRQTESETD